VRAIRAPAIASSEGLGRLASSAGKKSSPSIRSSVAHQAGGTRQSVNAALRGFERRGWIEAHDRVITIRQPAALGRFADVDVSAR
jgi:Crp-like helix-turn-helix domain